MNEPISSVLISKWVISIFWSFLGGIVHAIISFRKGKIKNRLDFLSLAFISGFSGLMWGLIALKFYPTEIYVIAFFSGAGGFMSLEGLSFLLTYVFKNKFKIEITKDNK